MTIIKETAMDTSYQYMNREQNAARLARDLAKKKAWILGGVLLAGFSMLFPIVLFPGLLNAMLGFFVALAILWGLYVSGMLHVSDFAELDAEGYSRALAITQASEPCRALVASWTNGGELFLTWSDLAELLARQPMLDLAKTVDGKVAQR